MTRTATARTHLAIRTILLVAGICVPAFFASAAIPRANKTSEARYQFERAVRMRTQLEGYLPRDRSLANYKDTIAAYHKVYLLSPQAEEVTPSLIAEAELYTEMGRQFDAKYFQSAIDTYDFLLKQYPRSQYRPQALFAIARIEQVDLDQPEAAIGTYKDLLKRFPKSERAADARDALNEIADARQAAAQAKESKQQQTKQREVKVSEAVPDFPALKGELVAPRESDNRMPYVTGVRTWNSEGHTRVVVTLNDTVKFDAMHVASPERLYFDLHRAQIDPKAEKSPKVDPGLLKSVRIGQNKPTVVRVVLDVGGAKNYSTQFLSNPYRLVIDVRTDAAIAPPRVDADSSVAAKAGESLHAAARGAAAPPPPANSSADLAAKPTISKSKVKADKIAGMKPAPAPEPKPNRDGQRSLTRALGLKISRIVIDPGHGGHDTGTIGPHGLMEKDLCLDVALRLGALIEQKLPSAEVVYTRKDDTFVALEDRTVIANQAKADLFISIHANSSHDHDARGIETYYLNFATSAESMEVATRENALSQSSLHDLQDIIKKIARNEKIEESKELANDIQDSLTHRLQVVSQQERNRGVKKAPFIVLIGANMPSVLSEISFISNPSDERLLRKTDQRQRVADGLYRGIATYLDSLNSLSMNKSRLVSEDRPGTVAPNGNHK
ncbi:MAG: N-acetylmuramoyl-L-alanine amidase [Candidatus Acidiferrales bacterium]